jgi:hypothetical protein
MTKLSWLWVTVCVAARLVSAQQAKPLTAEAILDRYVQVTGGLDIYHRYGSFSKHSSVTRADGTTFYTAVSHGRDGAIWTEIDAGENSREMGVANGVAWEYSKKQGAKILTGKVAARRIAEARGLDADDWRVRFTAVKSVGTETVNSKPCYHLKLTQTDGSIIDRFYDTRTGLLVREVATDFDENGTEQPVTTDVEEYDTTFAIKHPSLLRIEKGGERLTIHVDSLTFLSGGTSAGSIVPRDVVRAVAASRSNGTLPNAVDIIDKFVQATGGRSAYGAIKTEAIQAEITFPTQNLKFPVVMYATKRKTYVAMDSPSLGKFEFGSDGTTGWEKSVVLGPRLQPASTVGGLLGPSADDVLHWTESDLALETLAKEDVNASPCYEVKMGRDIAGQPTSIAWFDEQTGLLVKVTTPEIEGGNVVSVETTFGNYRSHGDFKVAHHIETKVADQQALIDVKEFSINEPLPEGVFDLPPDVRALKEKKMADMKKAGDADPRPTLKKDK